MKLRKQRPGARIAVGGNFNFLMILCLVLSVTALSERNFNLYVFTGGSFTGGKILLDSGGREATGRVGVGIEIIPLFGIKFDYIPIISDLDTDKDA